MKFKCLKKSKKNKNLSYGKKEKEKRTVIKYISLHVTLLWLPTLSQLKIVIIKKILLEQ